MFPLDDKNPNVGTHWFSICYIESSVTDRKPMGSDDDNICLDGTFFCLKQMNSTFCKRHKRSIYIGTLYVIGNFCNHSSLNCCKDFFSSIHVAENIHVHMNNGKIKSHLILHNKFKVMKIFTVKYACHIKSYQQ